MATLSSILPPVNVSTASGTLPVSNGGTGATTLTGYVKGRRVPPIPDVRCNITAHVAVDALADISTPPQHRVRSQRDALAQLPLPDDPLARLYAEGRLATLRAANGLGNFTWLEHHAGRPARHATMTS